MATRGRPRVHPKGMSPAQIKREWDKKMRNDDGHWPDEPKRKPCVIYLSEEARQTISDERAAAKQAGISPVLTSKLIEDLLRFHAANPLRPERAGLSSIRLRDHLNAAKALEREVMFRLAKFEVSDELQQFKTKPNLRTLRRLLEAEIKNPMPKLENLVDLFETMWRRQEASGLEKLLDALRRLFRDHTRKDELLAGMRHLLYRHMIGEVLVDRLRLDPPSLNWKAPT